MPRPPRIQASETIYHLNTRGNRSEAIVRDDSDRNTFLAIFGDVVKRHELTCISYCVMTTHYHLQVETANDDLSRAMERLNGLYARSFNRRHGLRGHVFEKRFHSELVESEAHLLETVRYIVLNPVRAGICRLPEEWPWSSHNAVLGLAPAPDFFHPEHVLSYFDHDLDRARQAYRLFVLEGLIDIPSISNSASMEPRRPHVHTRETSNSRNGGNREDIVRSPRSCFDSGRRPRGLAGGGEGALRERRPAVRSHQVDDA
jgi:putative transposase